MNLAQQLATEQPMVFELLVTAIEQRDPRIDRRLGLEFEARRQIDPEIGHNRQCKRCSPE